MAKITFEGDTVKAEPIREEKCEILHFTPKIIVKLIETGRNWTLTVEPRKG